MSDGSGTEQCSSATPCADRTAGCLPGSRLCFVDGEGDDEGIVSGIRATLDDAVDRLATAGARDEALATFVPSRQVLLFTKKARMIPLGRAWRLGVFLLARDGTLHATGSITRAVAPGHPGYQSVSAENRREHRAAAFRGPFIPGEPVNFDVAVIELDAASLRSSRGPLFLRDKTPLVRWSPTVADDTAVRFDAYLEDRVSLLLNPPEGA